VLRHIIRRQLTAAKDNRLPFNRATLHTWTTSQQWQWTRNYLSCKHRVCIFSCIRPIKRRPIKCRPAVRLTVAPVNCRPSAPDEVSHIPESMWFQLMCCFVMVWNRLSKNTTEDKAWGRLSVLNIVTRFDSLSFAGEVYFLSLIFIFYTIRLFCRYASRLCNTSFSLFTNGSCSSDFFIAVIKTTLRSKHGPR